MTAVAVARLAHRSMSGPLPVRRPDEYSDKDGANSVCSMRTTQLLLSTYSGCTKHTTYHRMAQSVLEHGAWRQRRLHGLVAPAGTTNGGANGSIRGDCRSAVGS